MDQDPHEIPEEVVIKNSNGRTRITYVDPKNAMNGTLTLYVDSISMSLVLKDMLPDNGAHFLDKDAEAAAMAERNDVSLAVPALAFEGVLMDDQGDVVPSTWCGLDNTVMVVIPDSDIRMNLIGNILASVLDERRLNMGLQMLSMLIDSRNAADEDTPTAIYQSLIDANAINGKAVFAVDQDGEGEPMTPSKEALDIMFQRQSKED